MTERKHEPAIEEESLRQENPAKKSRGPERHQEHRLDLASMEKEDKQRAERDASKIRKQLTKSDERPGEEDHNLFGDFKDARVDRTGRIKLNDEQKKEIQHGITQIKKQFRFSLPSLLAGAKTATEYDNKVGNFSTRTRILTTEDGKKVFAVYNYPTSWFHRMLDGLSKRLSGDKMSKAKSRNWKRTFEARSNVPIIESNDPRMVLMPYLPNMNAYDVFARNKEIKDFGPCPWAEEIDLEGKLKLADKIIDEVSKIHASGRTWGETILPNMIITPEQEPVIVDPETQYDLNVPLQEQRARDLRDIIMSFAGSLHASEEVTDYVPMIKRLLERYPDKEVVQELKKVAAEKPTFIQKLFRGFYETARLGIDIKEYQKVVEAITLS